MSTSRDEFSCLALKAQAGDKDSFDRLVRYLSVRLVPIARRILGATHPDLDDAVQEALLATLQALPQFRGTGGFYFYASQITARICVRQQKAYRKANQRDIPIELLPELPSSQSSPSQNASAAQRRALVRSLVAELPDKQSEVIVLRIMLGFELKEVAQATGISVNTVRSRLRVAMKSLEQKLVKRPDLRATLEGI